MLCTIARNSVSRLGVQPDHRLHCIRFDPHCSGACDRSRADSCHSGTALDFVSRRTRMTRLPVKQYATLLKDSACNWHSDRAPRMGAALAYYITLSLAPTVVIVLAIAGLAAGAEAAQGRLIGQIQGLVD